MVIGSASTHWFSAHRAGGGQPYADPAESFGKHRGGNRFAVNKHAVTIEDDQGSLRWFGQRAATAQLSEENYGFNIPFSRGMQRCMRALCKVIHIIKSSLWIARVGGPPGVS